MTARLTLNALALIAFAFAGDGASSHEMKAEVLRESDLLRFPTARRPADSERNKIKAQACKRAKFAAENQLIRTKHERALRYSECACSYSIRGGGGSFRHWFECRVEASGRDLAQNS